MSLMKFRQKSSFSFAVVRVTRAGPLSFLKISIGLACAKYPRIDIPSSETKEVEKEVRREDTAVKI